MTKCCVTGSSPGDGVTHDRSSEQTIRTTKTTGTGTHKICPAGPVEQLLQSPVGGGLLLRLCLQIAWVDSEWGGGQGGSQGAGSSAHIVLGDRQLLHLSEPAAASCLGGRRVNVGGHSGGEASAHKVVWEGFGPRSRRPPAAPYPLQVAHEGGKQLMREGSSRGGGWQVHGSTEGAAGFVGYI